MSALLVDFCWPGVLALWGCRWLIGHVCIKNLARLLHPDLCCMHGAIIHRTYRQYRLLFRDFFILPTDWASLATSWLTAVLYCIRSYRHNRVPVHWGFCRLCFQSLPHKLISGSWHWLNKWQKSSVANGTEVSTYRSNVLHFSVQSTVKAD